MRFPLCIAILAMLFIPANIDAQAQSRAPSYIKDIRPLFVSACTGCHNATTVANVTVSGGFALDSYAALMRGAKPAAAAYAVVMPGKPDQSLLPPRLT